MRAERTYNYRLRGEAEIGETIEAGGRSYRLVDVDWTWNKNAEPLEILTFAGHCQHCGAPFSFKTMRSRFWPTASCPDHRPGSTKRGWG